MSDAVAVAVAVVVPVDDESSRRHSYLSYGSSQNPASSSSHAHGKVRYMRSGSGQSLNRPPRKPSSSRSAAGRQRLGSQFSRESEGSFYSCGSLLDDLDG